MCLIHKRPAAVQTSDSGWSTPFEGPRHTVLHVLFIDDGGRGAAIARCVFHRAGIPQFSAELVHHPPRWNAPVRGEHRRRFVKGRFVVIRIETKVHVCSCVGRIYDITTC